MIKIRQTFLGIEGCVEDHQWLDIQAAMNGHRDRYQFTLRIPKQDEADSQLRCIAQKDSPFVRITEDNMKIKDGFVIDYTKNETPVQDTRFGVAAAISELPEIELSKPLSQIEVEVPNAVQTNSISSNRVVYGSRKSIPPTTPMPAQALDTKLPVVEAYPVPNETPILTSNLQFALGNNPECSIILDTPASTLMFDGLTKQIEKFHASTAVTSGSIQTAVDKFNRAVDTLNRAIESDIPMTEDVETMAVRVKTIKWVLKVLHETGAIV